MMSTVLRRDAEVPMEPKVRQMTLLERIALGEHEAVSECLDCYGGLVWGLARRLTSSLSDAEDAVQEIFTDVWLSAGRFDPQKSSESTFIGLLARRRLIDRLRRENRKLAATSISIAEFDLPSTSPESDVVELADEVAKAQQCLERLSKVQRTVIGLSIHHGLSHGRISDKLEMPLGTVKSYARRALILLRDCMLRRPLPQGGPT